MGVVYFTDIAGRRYAIPDDVLATHEVHGDLPDDERLTGLELDPTEGRAGADVEGYVWRMRETEDGKAVEYTVSPRDPDAGQGAGSSILRVPGATVSIHGDRITIQPTPRPERLS